MLKRIYIVILLLCSLLPVNAQQDAMYSEYVFNPLLINPALAGNHDVLGLTALHRSQWVGVPGAPRTGVFSIDAPLLKENVGVGFSLEYDKLGVTSHTGFSGTYSYKLNFAHSYLRLGLQVGLGFSNADFASVDYTDGGTQNDPAFQNNFHDVIPSIGFGAYYATERFFAGLSIPQFGGVIIQNMLYHSNEDAHLDLANHYFVTAGYSFDLSSEIKMKPSVLVKCVKGAPMEIDVNDVFYMYDLIAAGVSYRSMSSLNFLVQVKATRQLYVGYAYESATTALRNYKSGSHEIMLQYYFDFSKSKIVTPRFF